MKQHRMGYTRRKQLAGIAFITPWLIGCVYFLVIPLMKSLYYSFGKVKVVLGGLEWTPVGFDNYIRLFVQDEEALPNLVSSLGSMAMSLPVIVVFSLMIAMVLNRKFRGRTVVRVIFFLPVIIASSVALGLLESDSVSDMYLSGSMGGMSVQSTQLTNLLMNMGISEGIVTAISGFTSDIFSLAWKSGIQILLFLAGLQTIPPQTYEAAKIEGATAWQSFWKITVPQLTPITLLILVYTMIDSFTDYANPYIVLLLETIRNINIGYASALAWVYFAVISIVLGAVFFLAREKKPVSEEVRR